MTTEAEPKWKKFLDDNKWTTYLAYQLKDSNNAKDTLLKYEALLTQCSYLSRMAYCPADIFCRMTQHLDVTPNAFNNYIRAIEKIYDKLFNYKCSFDSRYIQKHPEFSEYFEPVVGEISAPEENSRKVNIVARKNNTNIKGTSSIGFFVQNKEHMNVYLYVHHNLESKFNTKKTLFIAFKGSSSINDFIHDLKSAAKEDLFLSELNEEPNKSSEFKMMEMEGGLDDPLMNPGQEYGSNIAKSQQSNPQAQNSNIKIQPGQPTQNQKNKPQKPVQSTPQSQNKNNKIKPGKGGWGFIHVLKPSIQEICKKIGELKSHNFERVIITGHSLGGALASLFGYYLKQYKSQSIKVPIHVVTFGACCVFDAPGRNEFNEFLNISDPVFTLDRVTANFDPVIVLPIDLDHPGYTLLRGMDDYKAFSKTGRTNEIGEIRKMLGLEKGYDGNDLLLSPRFVDLFTNAQDFKGTGKFNTDLYREKFRIKFGSNAKEQQLILEKAMLDAIPVKIRELFKTIESDAGNKRYNDSEQKGGLHNPLSFEKRASQKLATTKYKKKTKEMMPNQIQYSCYKTMTMGFCHASYMGVSYIMVLRLPNIKGGYKAKKEPIKDYTLYQKDERIFSSASGNYTNNNDCKKIESNVLNNSSSQNAYSGAKSRSNNYKNSVEEEKQKGVFSKCSIL